MFYHVDSAFAFNSRLLDIYIEYVLVGIAKFRFSKGAYNIKDMYAVYALKILCSEYDVCRKNLYDFLVQSYKPV